MADKIRYTWSGTAGAALNRYYSPGDPATGTYTYGPATPVLAGAQEFALVYDKRAKSYAVTSGESAEMPLASYDSNTNLATSTITGTSYLGEYFVPTLPSGALTWKLTRVKFKARVNGFPDGILTYQIRTASAGLPTSTVLDSGTLNESRFSSFFTWQQVNFTTASGLTPGSGVCFLLMLNSSSPAGDIQYQSSVVPTLTFNALSSPGSSTAWTAPIGQSMNFQAYGTVTAPTATVTQYNLTGVRVTLRNTVDTSGRVRATVRTLNEPPVGGP
jgi:hypothetical protein